MRNLIPSLLIFASAVLFVIGGDDYHQPYAQTATATPTHTATPTWTATPFQGTPIPTYTPEPYSPRDLVNGLFDAARHTIRYNPDDFVGINFNRTYNWSNNGNDYQATITLTVIQL